MQTRNYAMIARQYARDVVAGKLPACKWVRLACQRQLDDLERFKGKDSAFQFNPKLTDKSGRSYRPADNLCAFIERLPHVKGPLAGQPIRLEPWQVFVLTTIFGWVKLDGKRRFRRAYIEVPRGNGKALAADTLIPTPSGFKPMADVLVGDQVFDEKGRSCNVTAVTDILLGRPCYRITFSTGETLIADESHEWLTSAANPLGGDVAMRVRTTYEIYGTQFCRERGEPNHSIALGTELQLAPVSPSRQVNIVVVEPIASVPVKCIEVDSSSHLYLAGESFIPTHNSALSSALALYMLAADGELGAEIYSLATTRDQARIVFGDAQAMARQSAGFRTRFGVGVGAHNLNVLKTGSKFEALSAEGSTLDGLNIHLGCIDELHAHKTRTVYDVVETGTGKRDNSLLWVITTAGSNRAGICYEVRTFVTKLLDGVFEDDSQFGIVYGLDADLYFEPLQPARALQELERSCNCGLVHSIQIGRQLAEGYANHATTSGTGSRVQSDATNTRNDPSERGLCAAHVTSNGSWTETPSTKHAKSKSELNGPRGMSTRSGQHESDGVPSLELQGSCSTESDSSNTESPKSNSIEDLQSRAGNARSASRSSGAFASTIATAPVPSEDSCARSATRRSAFSETLRRVYDAHSLTCKARELKLEGGILYIKRPADDWTLEESLIKANPNWGISVRPEVLIPLQAKAMQMPSAVNNFKTKHLNEWVNADTSWMDMRSWDRCADSSLELESYAGQPCWIGLDLASKTDIAALLLVFTHPQIDGGFAVFGRYYLPEDTVNANGNSQYAGWMDTGRLTVTPGNVIDFSWIEADLIDFASRFSIQTVAFDPFQATQLSTRMMSEGLPMIELRPTVLNFSEPMKTLEALVLQGKLIHDGCPVLGWMASNVVAHLDAKDNIYPRKERPENKIDGIVALIMAISRAIAPGTSVVLGSDYELVLL